MDVNPNHQYILNEIKKNAGSATGQTFTDTYLGNSHPRYPIGASTLRAIAKEWCRNNRQLSQLEFLEVLDSLITAESSTEKMIAGMIMDCAKYEQVNFNPKVFDEWLEHLEGWAEVDSICTGKFTIRTIPSNWKDWDQLLKKFAKSKNIHKRRASLVFLCSPIRYCSDSSMRDRAFSNIKVLSDEKHILITKAISWLLRSMVKNHKQAVKEFVNENKQKLPAIAVRETNTMLKTGTKTKRKK